MMREKKEILWMTQTAVLTALLIVVQMITSSLGNTLVTGSFVNCLLIVAVMICGLKTGLWVAVLSPAAARLLGIGPLWSLIPVIALANAALVFIWHSFMRGQAVTCRTACIKALTAAAAVKFAILYLGIVKVVVPVFLQLPDKQAAAVSHLFSLPQLATALIGGAAAAAVLPVLVKVAGRGGKH